MTCSHFVPPLRFGLLMLALILVSNRFAFGDDANGSHLRTGAAAVEIAADDSMIIGGSIHAGRVKGQEAPLRAVALVLATPNGDKLAIVACDVLMLTRDLLDPVVEEIQQACGIPASHILINATHTHHAPSTVTIHGYERCEPFCRNTQKAIVKAVKEASTKLSDSRFSFWLGEESSVGQNSRLLLRDGSIFWIGPKEDAVRPTGPFDPELPVFVFRSPVGKLQTLWFNHSTHTIGTRKGAVRSPSFYGLACQELEKEQGGVVGFLEGASGSTHNLSLDCDEAATRIKSAVKAALASAIPRPVSRLSALKRKVNYRVRTFDDAKEDAAVTAYCQKRVASGAQGVIDVFRKQRQVLSSHQGEQRTTWVQAIAIGDVAIVGVPAEFFTILGEEIKRRSPYRYTYVAELANDWIGYLPDRKAFELGGYQTWTGLHSFAEPGTGERVVGESVRLLNELAGSRPGGE
jgi:neutral ceramidase